MPLQNNDDFKEFLKLLIKNNVEYLIVGGYAVSFHSRPRYTDDLDVWINKTKNNLQKLLNALKDFGFSDLPIDEKVFLNETKIYRFGKPPLRIEVLNKVDGVSFPDAYKNRVLGSYEDLSDINYISYDDLVLNKKSTQRTKDKLDLDYLKTYKKK